uniref:Uncharacterized protein n=1 Tax=Tetranychus urticae TaxID=32264 RepID=T1JUU7_TETUR
MAKNKVASIVGRAELLSALFSLSGLLYYCSYNGNNHDNNGDNNTNNDNKNNNPGSS